MSQKPMPEFAINEPGKKVVMLGNVAIARGILEAGVKIASGYPGTPSSDIIPAVAACVPFYPNLEVEWSVNEKVAFEVALGGCMSNARSVAAMKHVGVNVASDAFMTAAYRGVRGGMVLISADDPSQFSSQNEQDNRYYGLHALVPVFEPSNPQEAKDLIKYAFDYSEKYNTIVLFRTTTRLNHGRGDVVLGEIKGPEDTYRFDWDRNRWVCVPSNSRPQRRELLDRMKKMEYDANDFPFNNLTLTEEKINGKRIGFISSGIAYAHLLDALHFHDIKDNVSILKLGLTNPLPKRLIEHLLKSVDELLVVEELEPIIEEQVKALAYEKGITPTSVKIHGKDLLPQQGELKPETIIEKVAKFVGLDYTLPILPEMDITLPPRLPQMCPACHHRNTYWALKKAEKKLKKRFINNNDIGCYSLGVYKPLEAADTALCMGGSIGMANGMAKIYKGNEDIVVTAFLGDSTLFHSGIPPLINAVYNQNDMLIIISDNSYTSMTGGQDNPGNGIKVTGDLGTKVSIHDIVLGCGVPEDHIWVQEAYDFPTLIDRMEEAAAATGVRVFISKHMCSLQEMRLVKKQKIKLPVVKVDPKKCTGCQICVRKFGCPAINFNFDKKKAYIDQTQCRGCKSCITICPSGAFYVAEE
ncbi:MAG: indolepyruvate ferredoxin oxidoreductase subunit alpha [Promethearchaeota archaeon]